MFRYVCHNPSCLNTFLSHHLDIFKRCELCDGFLIHIGKLETNNNEDYPPTETIEDLKDNYIRLRKYALKWGLTNKECLTVGRAVRKISFEERKRLLQESGLWDENVIYKHVKTKEGLWMMVINKSAMRCRDKKKRNR